MMSKVVHFVLSLLIMGFTAGLVYKAAVATQQALNEANSDMFEKSVNGRLLDPVVSGLTEKFNSFKTVAETLGDMYKEEKVSCKDIGTKFANTADTAGYLRAAIGLQKAWIRELVYVYISYQISPGVWGDCGCEVGSDGVSVTCYYVNQNVEQLTFNSAVMTGTPVTRKGGINTYNQSYTEFAANMTSATAGQGAWQAPYVYTDPVSGKVDQLVTYTYPVFFDTTTGLCTAAAQVDFALTAADTLLNEYLPTSQSHIVFYNSKGAAPDAEGVFVTGTNQTQVHPSEEVWPAIGARNPYPWVYDLIVTAVGQLKGGYNFLNVTGSFVQDSVYYEARTIDSEWTLVLETPEDAYFKKIDKWSPKVGLSKEDLRTIWSDVNTIGILGIAVSVGVFAIINILAGCCCSGDKKKRSANDEYYMQSTA